jgi:hypothetical protein
MTAATNDNALVEQGAVETTLTNAVTVAPGYQLGNAPHLTAGVTA